MNRFSFFTIIPGAIEARQKEARGQKDLQL